MSSPSTNHEEMVVVPLQVHAMWVDPSEIDETRLAGAAADFSKLTAAEYHEGCISSFPERPISQADVGVHLQWKLPPPLNLGRTPDPSQTAGEEGVSFPLAPNRWLVTRFSMDAGVPQRCWVIESDFCRLDGEGGGTTVPLDIDGRLGHARLGRCVPLEDWVESDPGDSCASRLGWPLTAVGWGDPAFSAYYPGCRNVFGFHDSLEDAVFPEGALFTYLVVGWHSRPEDDILVNERWRKSLPWGLRNDPTGEHLARMKRSLYSGVAFQLRVSSNQPVPHSGTVVLGNSVQETVSAYLSQHQADRTECERKLHALLTGLDQSMPSIDRLDCQIDEAAHALRFLSREAGRIWGVRRRLGAEGPEKARSEVVLPPGLAAALAEYNAAQREIDYAVRDWAARRRRIRDDLSLLEKMIADPGAYEAEASRWSTTRVLLRERLERDLAGISSLDLAAIEARLQAAKEQAEAALAAASTSKNPLELYDIPAPRFWQPRDPIVLISQKNWARPLPSEEETQFSEFFPTDAFPAKTQVRCQRSEEIINATAFLKFEDRRCYSEILGDPRHSLQPLHRVIFGLLIMTHREHVGPYRARSQSLDDGYRPVYLRWHARYRDTPGLPPTPQFHLRDHSELLAANPPAGNEGTELTGIALVDSRIVAESFRRAKILSPSTTFDIEKDLWSSASLSGLHDQLLMYRSGIGLSIKDRARLLHLPGIPPWLGNAQPGDDRKPDPKLGFFPLRSGQLEIQKLELIDIFGRIQTIDFGDRGHDFLPATSLSPSASPTKRLPIAQLPPRLTVPSRLAFRFKALGSEASDSSDSPVHGWIIPSHLEKGFVFCAPNGDMIGILRDAANLEDFPRFMAAPGRSIGSLKGHCRKLLEALLDKTLPMDKFRKAVTDEILQMVPEERQHHAGIGHLMGKPLAIVTAEIGIDLEGDLPPRRQGLAVVNEEKDDVLSRLAVPVLLGDSKRLTDGLAAFFLPAKNGGEFDYAGWSEAERSIVRLPGCGRQRRLPLLMLLDPQAPVHATTGLFPVKSISLPAAYFQAAREKLGVLFPCGPILVTNEKEWTLPLPPIDEQRWHWTDAAIAAAGGGWNPLPEPPPLPVDTELPRAAQLKGRIWLTLRSTPAKSAVASK